MPAYRKQYLRIARRRRPDARRGLGRPLFLQNAFSAAPIFSLASRPGFCDKFGSSEMIAVRTLFFPFCVLKSSPRERGVVLIENQQLSIVERDLRDAPNHWRGSLSCVPRWGLLVPRLGHGLGVAPLFVRSPGLSYTKEHP